MSESKIDMPELWIYAVHLAMFAGGIGAIRSILRSGLPRAGMWSLCLGLCGVMAAFTFWASEPQRLFEDFGQAYHLAGAAVLNGPDSLVAEYQRGVHGFVNLPVMAYLFAPFGALSFKSAAVAFFAAGIACILAAWILLVRTARLSFEQAVLLLFIFAAFGPLHNSVKEGNTSHVILAVLAAALLAQKHGKEFISGLLLGLAALLKLPLLLFGVYYLAMGRFKIVLGGAVACVALGLISLASFGWSAHTTWYDSTIAPFSAGDILAFNVQSLRAFIGRFEFGSAVLLDWTLHPLSNRAMVTTQALSLLIVIVCVFAFMRRYGFSRQSQVVPEIDFSIVVVLSCLLSPLAWSHYFTWLLIPIAYFLSSKDGSAPACTRCSWAAIVLLVPPVLVVGPQIRESWMYSHVLVSHLFIAGVGVLCLLLSFRLRQVESETSTERAKLYAG